MKILLELIRLQRYFHFHLPHVQVTASRIEEAVIHLRIKTRDCLIPSRSSALFTPIQREAFV